MTPETTPEPEQEPEQEPREALPPSVQAARRAGRTPPRPGKRRAYVLASDPVDTESLAAELAATQALLRAESAQEVGAVVATLVHDLGGGLVLARYADPAMVVPLDVSLGESEPLLPYADPVSVASMRLRGVLPGFLEAARVVQRRLHEEARRDEELSRDGLTGVLTRRAWMRRLAAAGPDGSVCLLDLDRFKTVNDAGGHTAGDAVLRAFAGLLARRFVDEDACGRYAGDVFVCLAPRLSGTALVARCEQVRRDWERERPVVATGVGLSAGVAEIGPPGGQVALRAADTAMYRGKAQGGGRTVLAAPEDHQRAAR